MGESTAETLALDIAHEWQATDDGTVLNTMAFDSMANGMRAMIGTRLRVKPIGGDVSDDGPVIRNVRVEGDPGKRSISLDVEFDELTDPRLLATLMAKTARERKERVASLLVDNQNALRQLMSDVSEDCWCASWLDGCEYALWHFVLNGPGEWGVGEVTQTEVEKLKRLSELVGGWFAWSEDESLGDAVFVPMAEWVEMYRKHVVDCQLAWVP